MAVEKASSGTKALRKKVIRIARSWIGTPYKHQASLKGQGADCLGVLRGVYREVYDSPDPAVMPNYSTSWKEHRNDDPLIEVANEFLDWVHKDDRQSGDVLIFRMKPRIPAKHCGIMGTQNTLIHAYSGHECLELDLSEWWIDKIAAAYRFREVP